MERSDGFREARSLNEWFNSTAVPFFEHTKAEFGSVGWLFPGPRPIQGFGPNQSLERDAGQAAAVFGWAGEMSHGVFVERYLARAPQLHRYRAGTSSAYLSG
jgi:hypothetical protein